MNGYILCSRGRFKTCPYNFGGVCNTPLKSDFYDHPESHFKVQGMAEVCAVNPEDTRLVCCKCH
jgi:hypothetical protein